MTLVKNPYKYFILITLYLLLFSTGCNEYTPKPKGYNRIDNIESGYIEYNFQKFSFKYSDAVRIDTLQSKEKGEVWFNIVYPQYNAIVYCTYLPISKVTLPKILEDSHRLAYNHALKADAIDQLIYKNEDLNVSGTLYYIAGNVATPAQFYLTDSISHFFRGSFYYNEKADMDSVAPITDFVIKDIQEMINTFSWNNK
ncbi:gliding motility-associated lipoprotein GldD [Dysgonomonas alginatilytica]|uniref:Gliding motility-associated lipoprotein GldD n=1 Tax=Dysgonomonas alginatilytica TaxID=1605892 RepID=A0A2V3PNK7_9BACT|nr:hypothetical protein [Dysgonomonas alginatilytica]PXV63518.1 gliding motility-associated lipoprotein GldD [Dysgonomonas alginatilytica]